MNSLMEINDNDKETQDEDSENLQVVRCGDRLIQISNCENLIFRPPNLIPWVHIRTLDGFYV